MFNVTLGVSAVIAPQIRLRDVWAVGGEVREERERDTHLRYRFVPESQKSPKLMLRGLLVAPTGVDPMTFRFSVERSTN